MRRVISIVLSLMLIAAFLAIPVNAADPFDHEGVYGDFEYVVSDDEVTLVKYNGNSDEIVIPSEIEGCPVRNIGEELFMDKGIKKVTLPDTVVKIYDSAFRRCSELKDIVFPESLVSIGESAFSGCSSLESIVIPDSVTEIGGGAFFVCTSLKKLTLSENLSTVPGQAFSDCSSLEEVVIPESVTEIQVESFGYCYALRKVVILNPDVKINHAFTICTGLKELILPQGIKSLPVQAFNNTGLESVIIPSSVESIGDFAFGWNFKKVEDFIVYGYKDSAAEAYAQKNGFVFSEMKDQSDEDTGIVMSSCDDVKIKAEDISGSDKADEAVLNLSKRYNALAVYDISVQKNGETVQPLSSVQISIPTDKAGSKVFRMEEDGSLTDMNACYYDGYKTFTTDHLSIYILAESAQKAELLLGDLDGDGSVTVADVTLIQMMLANIPTGREISDKVTDTDGDGSLTIADATHIQMWLARLITDDNLGKPV